MKLRGRLECDFVNQLCLRDFCRQAIQLVSLSD